MEPASIEDVREIQERFSGIYSQLNSTDLLPEERRKRVLENLEAVISAFNCLYDLYILPSILSAPVDPEKPETAFLYNTGVYSNAAFWEYVDKGMLPVWVGTYSAIKRELEQAGSEPPEQFKEELDSLFGSLVSLANKLRMSKIRTMHVYIPVD